MKYLHAGGLFISRGYAGQDSPSDEISTPSNFTITPSPKKEKPACKSSRALRAPHLLLTAAADLEQAFKKYSANQDGVYSDTKEE